MVRDFLHDLGLPRGELNELSDSTKRFPDGAQYRVEIPSTEGPRCLEAVPEEAARLDVRVHRVSQGSGLFLQTDAELSRERVRRARLGMELLARSGYEPVASKLGAAGLALPAPTTLEESR